MLFLHLFAVSIFTGYIVLDRLIFRKFFQEVGINPLDFYKKSLLVMVFFVAVIIISGASMTYRNQALLANDAFVAKIFLSFLLFVMFFGCGVFLKNQKKPARVIYRFFVVVLLLIVFYLGTILN